jgi:uncharacterized protein (TIGR02466 family)
MEILNIFPTQIYKNFVNDNMKNDLLQLCNHYTSETTTNLLHIKNFPSTLANNDLSSRINDEPVVKMVFNFLFEVAAEFSQQRNQSLDYSEFRPYGFFSDMKQDAYLRRHAHKDCRFSGIIYLEVGNDVPHLLFHDPRPHVQFEPSHYCGSYIESVKPENGMLLLWDSWLNHEVLSKHNDQPRKSFTFNL